MIFQHKTYVRREVEIDQIHRPREKGEQIVRQEVKSILWFAPIILIGAIGIIYFALQTPNSTRKNTAPDFTLTALDGSKITLSNLRGKPVFLNFWSSW